MHFETSAIDTAPWVPPLVAFGISFFTAMGGVSGAFLLLPFQMSVLGITSPTVSATNHLFNVVAIPSGAFAYARERRMVWPLAWALLWGTLPGVLLGAIVRVVYLPDPRHFRLFAAAVLLYIGGRLLRELARRDSNPAAADTVAPRQWGKRLPRFCLRRVEHPALGMRHVRLCPLLGLSFAVGIVGGIYGIGGGAIIAPFLVSLFRLPVHLVAGAALVATFATSLMAVIVYQALALFAPQWTVAPDWALGMLFGLGGMGGIYLGARCQKYVPAAAIKLLLSAIMLLLAVQYAASVFSR